ncbi:MAG TPA: type 4a pilus biogenesis protein PilO [Bryobacterales bacterium]|nr:type 4a pilus biogenesis protein PilO [Bryobacterales bacterium]
MIRNFKINAGSLLGEPGPRRTITLALLALVLFDAVFYLFAIGPLGQSDRERRVAVELLRRQARDRSAQVVKLEATVKRIETARTLGDKLLTGITLPRREAYSTIVSTLDDAAQNANVQLRDRALNADPIEGSDTLSMMTVTQGLEGSYENLVKFLNLLDRSPRFIIIESLGAAPQQSGVRQQNTGMLSVQIKLDTFVREGV